MHINPWIVKTRIYRKLPGVDHDSLTLHLEGGAPKGLAELL